MVDDPHGFRLSQDPPQIPRRQDGSEIQQRSRNGGTGNAVQFASVRRRQASVSMGNDADWTASSTVGRRHMDRGIVRLPKTPEDRRRPMGKDGTRTAREHSRKEGGFRRRVDVANRIDAAMNSMEASGALASRNGPAVHSYVFELFQADQAMLSVSDPRDLQVPASRSKPRGRFVNYRSVRGRLVQTTSTFRPVGEEGWQRAHGALEAAEEKRAGGAQIVTFLRRQSRRTVNVDPRTCLVRSGVCDWRAPDQAGLGRKRPG